jgi:DsbC/DsbD-like thiol-disulfide interchange protein
MRTQTILLLGLWLSLGLPHLGRAQVEQPVSWRFTASPVTPAGVTTLTFTATIQGQWHIYSQFMAAGGPVPTHFTFAPSASYHLLGPVTEAAQPVKAFEESFKLMVAYFPKRAVFQQKVKFQGRPATINGTLTYMACNDLQCLPSEDVAFSIPVPVSATYTSHYAPKARATAAKPVGGLPQRSAVGQAPH